MVLLWPGWLHIPSWLYLMPGVYTLFLALLAGVVPTLKWYDHKSVKIAYGFLLGTLCLLEVGSIANDRKTQDDKHTGELNAQEVRFESTVSLLQKIQSAQTVQLEAQTALLRESEREERLSEKSQESGLKIRVLDLARGIGSFTMGVWMSEAELPQPATHGLAAMTDPAWARWEAQLEQSAHNGIAEYHMQFAPSVTDITDQLKKRYRWDSKECDISLNGAYTISAEQQFLYVEGCAQDLQREANAIP